MVKLLIKLNDSGSSFEISALRGKYILNKVTGHYEKNLADQLIRGLDKNLAYVKLKKRDKLRVFYDSKARSFVSNLIGNSIASVTNWLQEEN